MHSEQVAFDNEGRFLIYDSTINALKIKPKNAIFSFVGVSLAYMAVAAFQMNMGIHIVQGCGAGSFLTIWMMYYMGQIKQ